MRSTLLAGIAAIWALAAPASGEIFVLHTGGQVEGQLVNADEVPRQRYVIETPQGGRITLAREQVKEVVRRRPEELDYQRIAPQFPDTVAGQWELAEWCRQRHLHTARKKHLERVVALDPDHIEARRALGYTRVDGQWKTQDQAMTDRGYVQYKGRWLLPQEIELIERRRQQELAEKAWFANLKRWRSWLDGDKRQEALKHLASIREPAALPALRQYLADEPVPGVRKLYIEALATIGTSTAMDVLAERSLGDPDAELRLVCLDFLDDEPRPPVVEFYVQKLRDKDNAIVNRAAVGLARMKESSAVGPLIDALVTRHKFAVTTGSSGYSAMFSNQGSGFSTGSRTQIVTQEIRNPQVLDALVALSSGVNYGYDVKNWKTWLAAQRKATVIDVRRD